MPTHLLPKLALLVALSACLLVPAARADVITFRDGDTVEGEVLDEGRGTVTIKVKVAGIVSTQTYRRSQIKSIERKPLPEGFWDDDKPAAEEEVEEEAPAEIEGETEATEGVSEAEETEPSSRRGRARDPQTRFMIVPVQGEIGGDVTSHGLRQALLQAKGRGVGHVVFTVDSPGGYVYEAVQILEVLKEFDDEIEYHCLIEGGAISAASVFAAGSDRILVRPDARLGGAVAYSENSSSGAAEVDAKFNSIWAAEIASRADSKGHLGDVFRAMVVLEAELWQSADGKIAASNPGEGATQIDGPTTILTIRASQMVKAGMATEFAGQPADLGTVLGKPEWQEEPSVGIRLMTVAGRERREMERRVKEAVDEYLRAAEVLKANDPRDARYRVIRYDGGRYELDNNSMREWVARSDRAIKAGDTMLDSLKELASINTKAERTKALHLIIPPEYGHEAYVTIKDIVDKLKRERNSPPAREIANPTFGG